jgi:hypothetical protein
MEYSKEQVQSMRLINPTLRRVRGDARRICHSSNISSTYRVRSTYRVLRTYRVHTVREMYDDSDGESRSGSTPHSRLCVDPDGFLLRRCFRNVQDMRADPPASPGSARRNFGDERRHGRERCRSTEVCSKSNANTLKVSVICVFLNTS